MAISKPTWNWVKSNALLDAEKKKKQYDTDYSESEKVKNLYNDWQKTNSSKPSDWTGGTYGTQVNDALNNIMNRKGFTYDLNGDMLYQQYKDQYINQGKQAMMDTMGQAAALTGGYGNSYAQTVGQQTYQGYLQGLNDKVPELYQLALQKYQQEGDDLKDAYSLLKNQYDTEYGQYRDSVSDWNTDVDRAYNIYNNERSNEQTQFNTNRQYASDAYNNLYNQEYGAASDTYNRAFDLYKQQVAEQQAASQLALQQRELALTEAKNNATYNSKNGTYTVEGNTTSPKKWSEAEYKKASEIYTKQGRDAAKKYISSLASAYGWDDDYAFAMMDTVSSSNTMNYNVRDDWSGVSDGGWNNIFSGIDSNAYVKSGNEKISLGELYDKLQEQGLSKSQAKKYVIDLQKKFGY